MQLNADILNIFREKPLQPKDRELKWEFGEEAKRQSAGEPSFKVYKDDGTLVEPPQPMTAADIAQLQRDWRMFQVKSSFSRGLPDGN